MSLLAELKRRNVIRMAGFALGVAPARDLLRSCCFALCEGE